MLRSVRPALSLAILVTAVIGCEPEPPAPGAEETVAPGWVISQPFSNILSLMDVHVIDETLVYAVGTNASLLRYENGTWAREARPADVSPETRFESVSALRDPDSGVETVMAVGSGGTVVTRNEDGTWTRWDTPFDDDYFGVWLRRPDDAFIVGDRGRILRWDGTAVTWMEQAQKQTRSITDDNGNPATEEYDIPDTLKGVDGGGPDDVFAVGLAGAVFHFDGTSWNREDARTNRPFTDIRVGPGVWATATDGIVFRRTGDGWDDESFRAPSPLYLQGVWLTGGNDLFTVGMSGGVFHRDGGEWVTTQLGEAAHLRAIDGVITAEATEEEPMQRTLFAVGAAGRIVRGPQAIPGDDQPEAAQ